MIRASVLSSSGRVACERVVAVFADLRHAAAAAASCSRRWRRFIERSARNPRRCNQERHVACGKPYQSVMTSVIVRRDRSLLGRQAVLMVRRRGDGPDQQKEKGMKPYKIGFLFRGSCRVRVRCGCGTDGRVAALSPTACVRIVPA